MGGPPVGRDPPRVYPARGRRPAERRGDAVPRVSAGPQRVHLEPGADPTQAPLRAGERDRAERGDADLQPELRPRRVRGGRHLRLQRDRIRRRDLRDADLHPGCAHGTCAAPDTCDCAGTGFDGPTCADDVDECATDNGGCDADAACQNTAGGRTCACDPGHFGDGVTCEPCAAGEVQPLEGQASCGACPAGSYDDGGEVCATCA
ncbi:MAG: hypothetical protein CVU56_26505, partial [Deltaproteobacteria bacterium HGW-Deltaproteobacteria-14]